MLGRVVSGLFYSYILKIRQPGAGKYLKELETIQWETPENIKTYQWVKLKKLLKHTQEKSPFYRQLWNKFGISAEVITDFQNFQKLPLIEKEMIQNYPEGLLTTDEGLISNQTGGSTGTPLHFYQDQEYVDQTTAASFMATKMTGYKFGDKILLLWGSDFDAKKRDSLKFSLTERYGQRKYFFNTFKLTEKQIHEIGELLRRWKPDLVIGYASSLLFVARSLLEKDIKFPPSSVGVQSSAETLYPENRKIIEQGFGARVFNRYGSREFSTIAHECEHHEGMHILCPTNYVEIVKETGQLALPGETGEIVVTSLANWAMPFIRYRTGDLGHWIEGPCECGRGLPRVEINQGRIGENIRSPKGKVIHGEFFTHLFYKFSGIRKFQVIQKSKDLLLIRLVPEPKADIERIKAFLSETIREHGDEEFQIQFEMVDEIAPADSGKFRFVYSEIDKEGVSNN